MKFYHYLYDKKYFLLFYVILMGLVSTIIFLDPLVKVHWSNLLYLNILCFTVLLIYLISSYIYHSKMLHDLKNDIEVGNMPFPRTYLQKEYYDIIYQLLEEKQNVVVDYLNRQKEHMDYTNSWVHEVKTPIATLRLLLEFHPIEKEIKDSLEEEIDSIDDYIEQALYFSRIDDFAKDYLISDYDLADLVKSVIKRNKKAFISKNVNIFIDQLDFNVKTDAKWLTYILNQVIGNSLKYTPSEGLIKVYGEQVPEGIRLIVEDNGIGILPEDLPRIFEKSFTGQNGRINKKSTGLGLYMAKRLCEKLGHRISAESQVNQYSKIIIFFPKLNQYYFGKE